MSDELKLLQQILKQQKKTNELLKSIIRNMKQEIPAENKIGNYIVKQGSNSSDEQDRTSF